MLQISDITPLITWKPHKREVFLGNISICQYINLKGCWLRFISGWQSFFKEVVQWVYLSRRSRPGVVGPTNLTPPPPQRSCIAQQKYPFYFPFSVRFCFVCYQSLANPYQSAHETDRIGWDAVYVGRGGWNDNEQCQNAGNCCCHLLIGRWQIDPMRDKPRTG